MGRQMRIEYPGAVYHITSRGNEKKDIYYNENDRKLFLDCLTDVIKRHNWICHSYCLMSNHYHLLIETPEANLSIGMRQLNGVYVQKFNILKSRVGHLFQGRYKAIIVQRESYLLELCRYIVLNPVRAKLVNRPEDYIWSSYRATIGIETCPIFLTTDWVLSQFGECQPIAREKYIEFVYAGIGGNSPFEKLRGAIILGKENFIQGLEHLILEQSNDLAIPRQQRQVLIEHQLDLPPLNKKIKSSESRNNTIRELHYNKGMAIKKIAALFLLHPSSVSKIINLNTAGKIL